MIERHIIMIVTPPPPYRLCVRSPRTRKSSHSQVEGKRRIVFRVTVSHPKNLISGRREFRRLSARFRLYLSRRGAYLPKYRRKRFRTSSNKN